MKIRITYPIRDGEIQLLPGTIVEVKEKQAKEWIKQDVAVAFDDDPKPATPEVSDGDG